jgi:uncharacterized protein (TIGR03067 family)
MMKAAMLTLTAGAVLLAGGAGDEAALKKEKARLEGKWTIVKLTTPKGDEDVSQGATITFGKDGILEYRKGDETKKATFKLNPTAKPKEIDLSPDEDANKIWHGIYQIEKDKLKLCVDPSGNSQRPTEFAAPEGGNQVLVILEKAK